MPWPKGKPRKQNKEVPVKEPQFVSEIPLVKANADARKTALALAAKRDACITEMIKPYIEVYGPDKAPLVRRFLRDLIDGKPMSKPKPIRTPVHFGMQDNGKTAAA
jgi:hypothetical protein